MKKSYKGITLVVLVVTIIILLIIAGVSIAALKGSGLFEKAQLAKQKSEEEAEKENSILKQYEEEISYVLHDKNNETVVLADKIKQNITITNMTGTTFKINVTSLDANNSKKLYYYVDNKLVYEGTDKSYTVKGLEENSKHSVIVLADKNDMEIITGEGDNVRSWLACIGNTENLTIDQIIGNETLLSNLNNSEDALNYLIKSTEIILPKFFENENNFSKIANNSKAMKKICESEVCRKLMYDNYAITESVLAKSEVAINAMMNSSRYEVVSNGNPIGGSEELYKELYKGKAFVIGISQNSFNKDTRKTNHGLYINGEQMLKTTATLTYGTSGLVYRVNKFASEVRQHPSPGADRTGYSYAAIFKI